uniref:Uncharacterized protein n=1 Tax=Otolemur garnettii TaxID=30611 RepID=H0XX06_OTOGA
MDTGVSKKEAEQKIQCAFQTSKEAHVSPAAPALWPVMGAPCIDPTCMGLSLQASLDPQPWPWAPFGGFLWTGYLSPATMKPSIWSMGVPSFCPLVGNEHPAPAASSLFPRLMSPAPPYSSASPRSFPQTPASSASWAAVGGPTGGALYLKRRRAPPSEWASRFSIWTPLPPYNSELRPLPPSPIEEAQPDPHCPRPSRPPCRACRRLFEP